jgi:Tol biopolymer transport system component
VVGAPELDRPRNAPTTSPATSTAPAIATTCGLKVKAQEWYGRNPDAGRLVPSDVCYSYATMRRLVAAAIICTVLAAVSGASAGRADSTKWIVFSASPDGTAPAQLYRVQTDGTGVEQITKGGLPATDPAFSPNGKQLAFVRLGLGIFRVNLDGSGLQRLTRGHRDSFPAWSPNGARIAFLRPTKVAWNVYVMSAAGKGARRLPQAPSAARPTWASNTSLYLPTAFGLTKVDATKGRVQELYKATPDLSASQAVTVSPNGKTMAFVAHRKPSGPADCGESPCEQFGLNAVPVTKTKATEIANGSGPAGWSPDSKTIVFVVRGALTLASPNGTNRKPLISGPQVAQGDAPPAWQP